MRPFQLPNSVIIRHLINLGVPDAISNLLKEPRTRVFFLSEEQEKKEGKIEFKFSLWADLIGWKRVKLYALAIVIEQLGPKNLGLREVSIWDMIKWSLFASARGP